MPRSKWRLTLTRNRGFAYFWLMFMPRPVRVGYLLRRALRALALKRPEWNPGEFTWMDGPEQPYGSPRLYWDHTSRRLFSIARWILLASLDAGQSVE
jgi:hypothetical protein